MARKAIPFSTFVKVASTSVSPTFAFNRLNALVITQPSSFLDNYYNFTSVEAVAEVFGTTSEEYSYALNFFAYVSKNATMPERLSFWCYDSEGREAVIVGAGKVDDIATIKALGSQASITIGEDTQTLDVTNITSFGDLMGMLNTSYNDKGYKFYYQLNNIVAIEACEVLPSGNLADLLKLTAESGAKALPAVEAQTIKDVLNAVGEFNGDYVSISFIDNDLQKDDLIDIGEFANASKNRFVAVVRLNEDKAKTYTSDYDYLKGYNGLVLNYGDDNKINALTQAIIASVDYSTLNGNMNVNFIPATAYAGDKVLQTATELENINNNNFNAIYNAGGYGQGQLLYGEGNICGDNFRDITGYMGNAWLKASLEIAIMNLFISDPLVSLRGAGASKVDITMQGILRRALNGGIITAVGVGNLTDFEKTSIITQLGEDAVDMIAQNGYYVRLEPITDDDIKAKQIRAKIMYTRNTPTNRVAISVLILG